MLEADLSGVLIPEQSEAVHPSSSFESKYVLPFSNGLKTDSCFIVTTRVSAVLTLSFKIIPAGIRSILARLYIRIGTNCCNVGTGFDSMPLETRLHSFLSSG